jgi:hypothetical protein
MEYNILDFSAWTGDSKFGSTFNKLIDGLELFYEGVKTPPALSGTLPKYDTETPYAHRENSIVVFGEGRGGVESSNASKTNDTKGIQTCSRTSEGAYTC